MTIAETIDVQPHPLADEILSAPGDISDAGVHTNVVIGLRYVASWLSGGGGAASHGLTESAAIAETSRAQLSQWARHQVRTTSGRLIDTDYIGYVVRRELDLLTCGLGPATKARFEYAAELFTGAALDAPFAGFLTPAAYEQLPERSLAHHQTNSSKPHRPGGTTT